jgi:hypothetical protein
MPIRSMTALLVCALAVVGCREVPILTSPVVVPADVPRGAVRADIVQEPLAADGSVTFVVRVRTRDVVLSAFQGVVTFSPGAFELVGVTATDRSGETRLFNEAAFAHGRIRFAAMTPTTFAPAPEEGIEAFRFTVRPLRAIAEANLEATVEVASEEEGVALDAGSFLVSRLQRGAGSGRSK